MEYFEEVNRLMGIGELYHPRMQVPREQRLQTFAQNTSISPARRQIAQAESVISSINKDNPQPLPSEHWAIRRSKNNKKGIKVKEGGRHFYFDFRMNDTERHILYQNLERIVTSLAEQLTLDSKWLVQYTDDYGWQSFVITRDTIQMIIEQIQREQIHVQAIEEVEIAEPSESAFHCSIKSIKELHFLDVTAYPELVTRQRNEAMLQNQSISNNTVQSILSKLEGEERDLVARLLENAKRNTYGTREGQLFKFINTSWVNLERFQIFNRLTKREIEIMDYENCVVWALKMFGIEEEILEAVRRCIGTKHFPQSKFQDLANEFNLAFKIRYYEETKTRVFNYTPAEGEATRTIPLILFDDHYMLDESLPITDYYIRHKNLIDNHRIARNWTEEERQRVCKYRKDKDTFEKKREVHTSIMVILKILFEMNYMRPIHLGDFLIYKSTLYKEKLAPFTNLEYSVKYCTKLKEPFIPKPSENPKRKMFERKKVVYADFECSTDGEKHKAYMLCAMTDSGKQFSSWGTNCALDFLNWEEIIDGTQIYFHNLSYDINFILKYMSYVQGLAIIKNGRTMSLDCIWNGLHIRFKDSYSIISKKLKMFPAMFHLESGPKEIFPYTYYNSEVLANDNNIGNIKLAKKCIKESDQEAFEISLDNSGARINNNTFNMEIYAKYYCERDVQILHDGFEKFREDLMKEFQLDAYDFVSISSIANKLFEREVYYPNKNLYDLAGKPREYCSRAVFGGRCMCADNVKQINTSNNAIVDFDAVSLYPSAVARLYTIEGIPQVCKNNDPTWLLMHLMEPDQEIPTSNKFISGFVIQIRITKVNKPRHFPLIVSNPKISENETEERSTNKPCTMYVDHITLEDLIKYQQIEYEMINGYYWQGKRDFRIRDQIKKLFLLRKQYKENDNPVQEIIKLILNSVYGRTILKPIETKTVFKQLEDSQKFIKKNYNTIDSIEHIYDSTLVKFKQIKPINNHFNFCMLGIGILSMSKRIMNEVICLAEDLNIKIFYQDTDSMHLFEKDVPILAKEFEKVYGRPLIGKELGQFHSDFHFIKSPADKNIKAIKSIFCGKKSYLDMLTNENGDIGFHCRMKGITMQSLAITANKMFPNDIPVKCHEYEDGCILFLPERKGENYSIYSLYKHLYNGQEASFDLCDGSPRFELNDNYSVESKTSFIRKIKF